MSRDDGSFDAFVRERSTALLRTAYLLTSDRGHAEDLLQTALVKTYRHWDRITRRDDPSAFVRRVLVTTHAGWRRRRRVLEFTSETPLLSGVSEPRFDSGDRQDMAAARDDLAERVRHGHRARRRRGAALAAVVTAVVAVVAVVPLVLTGRGPDQATSQPAPDACVDAAAATRDTIEGTPVWARFCPGPVRELVHAQVPSDPLTTHLDLLARLVEVDETDAAVPPPGWPCSESSSSQTYELQIGYADGRVATLAGSTDPECAGALPSGRQVRGPDRFGVYGLAMTAFGRQYADQYDDSPADAPLVCPDDPRDPDSVSVDGASAALDTGHHMGGRSPMVMPLTAVRGILCTWPVGAEDDVPVVRALTAEDAERVRIGLHALDGGVADCAGSPAPTRTAVVEDRTGTRRAVSIIDSECFVIRSDRGPSGQGYGVGFPWLDG